MLGWFQAPLVTALLSMLFAQFVKVPLRLFKDGSFQPTLMFSTGGMPSSHSAMVTALAVSVGMRNGFASDLFAMSAVFSLIVMYDAMGIRRHAGRQAVTLNKLLSEKIIDPVKGLQHKNVIKQQLKEMLGHEPKEVIWGAITGIAAALLLHSL
ncbi:divergent PAP2 family protein [Paenibacillus filicis]|uniref:Divergent PAP2 family protein n=1 Tax=Paenibacillus gyeongsangnamensis TaxID=3388067 RepID=A0ABT4QHT1_9BACL|nr:divergent PAP2 family protein [Paenibacillus filicis]MCZ8516447.1 divergent PAP2 family protein [Paenibacillus filicis]